jgi:hypothetical protein
MKNLIRLCLMMLGCAAIHAQSSPYSNLKLTPTAMTATAQTSAAIGLDLYHTGTGNSFATGTLTVTGTALTTATFGVLGSSDGGNNYFPVNLYPVLTPTAGASTQTVTAAAMFYVNLAGLTHIKYVTSGTFTATSITILVTASPNAIIARKRLPPIVYVGDATAFSNVAVTSFPISYSCTAGNLVHVAGSIFSTTTTAGISSSPAATWTAEYATMPVRGDNQVSMQVWDSTCPATGSQTITVTSTVSTGIWIAVSELHGTSPAKLDHVASGNADVSSTAIALSTTASFAGSAAIVDSNLANGVASFVPLTAGFTARASNITQADGWQNPSVSNGPVAFTAGFNGGATAWVASIAIFHL